MSEFPINKSNTVDGHHARCKICYRLYQQQWRDGNPEKSSAYTKKWKNSNPEKAKEGDRKQNKLRRKRKTETARAWRRRHPDKIREVNQRQYSKQRAWAKEHPEVYAYHALVRRRMQKQACPQWLTSQHKEQIRLIYKSARTKSEFHEIDFHVDHIEPIKGVDELGNHVSCGLHVPWNLQVLTAEENLLKKNKLNYKILK